MRKIVLGVLMLFLILGTLTAAGDKEESVSADGPVTVSIALWNVLEPGDNERALRIEQKILDDFGIEFEIRPIVFNDYTEKLRLMMASDDLPDIFVGWGWDDKKGFKNLVDQQLIRAIPEEMYEKYPNLGAIMDKYSYETMPDGEMYHIPRDDFPQSNESGGIACFYYRLDYAEALGYSKEQLSEPMKISELTKFFEDMTFMDPDGNGKNDTIGLTIHQKDALNSLIFPMFGWREWVYEDNAWKYGYTSEPVKEATRWLWGLYRSGVLDPEFVLLNVNQATDKMASGQAGAFVDAAYTSDARHFRRSHWEQINPDLAVEDYASIIPLPIMEDGSRNNGFKSYRTVSYISSKVDDAKLDTILNLYDWMVTVDAWTYLSYGEEGVDYNMEDGKLVNLNTNIKGDPIRFYDENPMGPLVNLAAWNLAGNPEIPNPVEVPWDREIGNIMMENNWPYNGPAPFTKYLFLPAMERNLGLDTAALDELMRIIAQAEDFEADWDAYVAMLNKGYELKTITEEVNEAAAEMGISWETYK